MVFNISHRSVSGDYTGCPVADQGTLCLMSFLSWSDGKGGIIAAKLLDRTFRWQQPYHTLQGSCALVAGFSADRRRAPMKPHNCAAAPNPVIPDDPFVLLDHLPRSMWAFAADRFHRAIRRLDAEPTKRLSWQKGNVSDDMASLGVLTEKHANLHDLAKAIYRCYYPGVFAILERETGIAQGRTRGTKELRWPLEGTAQGGDA